MTVPAQAIERIATVVAEVERLNSSPQTPHWEDLGEPRRQELIAFVGGILSGRSVAQQHEAWLADQILAGWSHGETFDEVAKTDPDLVHWEDYAEARRAQLAAASHLVVMLAGLA